MELPVRHMLRFWGVLSGGLVCAAVSAAGTVCPVPLVESEVIGTTCPKVGRLGNVRLVVPQHYLLGPFTYKGVDVWDHRSFAKRPLTPSLEMEIDNFAVRVGVSDFQPVRTRADREEYLAATRGRKGRGPRWIHIGFEAYDADAHGTKKAQLENWLRDTKTGWGPFARNAESSWGLEHYVSIQRPSVDVIQRELFYDARTENTFIVCKNQLGVTPPHDLLTSCSHSFLLRDLKIRVAVDNIWHKDDLRSWEHIESSTRRLLMSFVVR